jgi:serine/threonine protein kinase/tetratricopeptide (TPR) repeat protein
MDERSRTIDTLFTLATHLPRALRDTLLEQATDDPDIRGAVRARLDTEDAPVDGPTGAAEPMPASGAARWEERLQDAFRVGWIGRHIGSYEITGLLGQGGMGTVYRARRADGQFEHDVAIKVVRHDLESPAALERLRLERQILARLTHPSIARLIDGGTVSDGVGGETPYFVMELVEGEPITTYCEARQLPLRDRLRLFRGACEAVVHAHQQLVVHRDLKPSNILITSTGQPKLLDFGIAKLLEQQPLPLAQTSTGMHLLTPEYASPEQVRGEPVTAMTDVYSLGAILYEVLTGLKAHRFDTRSPAEISRVICTIEATRPSTAVSQREPHALRMSRLLKGDLDTIVLMALRKDPARRYGSVEQLAEDVSRYLDGLPVRARPDTVGYRTSKFVQRHRVGVVAATLALAMLVGAVVVTTREARARAIEADRAQRQVQQIRKLATTLLVDLHDAVAEVPGATGARELIVVTAQRYLAAVASETGDDPSLRLELAESYRKIGDVQFNDRQASLGNATAALESYRQARSLLEGLVAREPRRSEYQRALADTCARMAAALSTSNDRPAALETAREAQRAAETAVALAPDDVRASLSLIGAYGVVGAALMPSRDLPAVLDIYQRALSAATRLAARQNDLRATEALARAHENVAEVLSQMGNLAPAVDHARQGIALLESITATHPTESNHRRHLMAAYAELADLLGSPIEFSLGEWDAAEAEYHKAMAVAEALAAADPRDAQAQLAIAMVSRKLGNVVTRRDPRAAVERHRRAIAIVDRLLAAWPQNFTYRRQQALNLLWLGQAQHRLGQRPAAMKSVGQALDLQLAILASDPTRQTVRQDAVATYNARGDLQLDTGDARGALDSYTTALGLAEQVYAAARLDEWARRDRIDCYERMGQYWARRGRADVATAQRAAAWEQAHRWHEKSLAEWREWLRLQPNVYIERRHEQAAQAVAACDTELAHVATAVTP